VVVGGMVTSPLAILLLLPVFVRFGHKTEETRYESDSTH
jgi:Cu/Ag efflux pump CusA